MPRKQRRIERASSFRDASLIVVATEDARATPMYLRELAKHPKYRSSFIEVKVLERLALTDSAPKAVKAVLDDYKRDTDLGDGDELWLVIDIDNWKERMLADVCRECAQSNYFTAISNPAVELWFLLHFEDISSLPKERQEEFLQNSKKGKRRTALERAIIEHIGEYSKGSLKVEPYFELTERAIEHSKKLLIASDSEGGRWPQALGTQMHRLIEAIKRKGQSKRL